MSVVSVSLSSRTSLHDCMLMVVPLMVVTLAGSPMLAETPFRATVWFLVTSLAEVLLVLFSQVANSRNSPDGSKLHKY